MAGELRVGLIGCGRIAQMFHLRALAAMPGSRLVALADAEPKALAAAQALAPSAAGFLDYQGLLARSDIDAVVVCLPSGMHAEAAVRALQANKHLYLEKPLAISREEGEAILDAWQGSGKVGMIGYNFRFHPLFLQMRKLLHEEAIGTVMAARAIFSGSMRDKPGWKYQRQAGGGVLLDLASHLVDRARFLFNREVEKVSASIRSIHHSEDTASITLHLEGGIVFQGVVSSCSVDEDSLEILGDRGKLGFDRYRDTQLKLTNAHMPQGRFERMKRSLAFLRSVPRLTWETMTPRGDPSFQIALEQFVKSIRHDEPVQPDLLDGYRSLAVIMAAEEAARSDRIISLEGSACESTASE